MQDPLLFQHDIKGNISIVLSKLLANEFYENIAFINTIFQAGRDRQSQPPSQ